MTNDEKQMADMLRTMDATNPLQHYEEYRDYLRPVQEIDYKDVADAFEKIINPGLTPEDHVAVNAVLRKALEQPIMADTYDRNGIKPQDVSEYVNMVMTYHPKEKEKLVRGLKNAYKIGADSMFKDGTLNHKREWYPLKVALGASKEIADSMTKFIESKTPVKEAPEKRKLGVKLKNTVSSVGRWFEKAIKGLGTVAAAYLVLGSGYVDGAALSKEGKNFIKQDNAKMAKENTQEKTQDASKTYQMKGIQDSQRQA